MITGFEEKLVDIQQVIFTAVLWKRSLTFDIAEIEHSFTTFGIVKTYV